MQGSMPSHVCALAQPRFSAPALAGLEPAGRGGEHQESRVLVDDVDVRLVGHRLIRAAIGAIAYIRPRGIRGPMAWRCPAEGSWSLAPRAPLSWHSLGRRLCHDRARGFRLARGAPYYDARVESILGSRELLTPHARRSPPRRGRDASADGSAASFRQLGAQIIVADDRHTGGRKLGPRDSQLGGALRLSLYDD